MPGRVRREGTVDYLVTLTAGPDTADRILLERCDINFEIGRGGGINEWVETSTLFGRRVAAAALNIGACSGGGRHRLTR